jgi:serine/threonine protein kinase
MDNCGFELFQLKNNLLYYINPSIRYETVISIFIKLLDSLKLIHNVGYIHCDIKLENYLIKIETKKIKIIDFGLVRKNLHDQKDELIGTPSFIANDFMINYFAKKILLWNIIMIFFH